MSSICLHCSAPFEISPWEEEFLRNGDFPFPTDCPACRRQQRLLFRNFFHLYHRTCDLTGKKIISMYDRDAPFPVYATQEWWSDRWDPLSYGISLDFTKPFFEQVAILHRTVPRMAVMNSASENTEYCNLCFFSRNCYLVHGCVNNEDCMYGHIVWRSKDCYDCLYIYQCEWCCECIDCIQCHSLAYSRDCDNCSQSMFLVHCTGCSDCFGCVGLKNKRYHIFNEPHTKEEYERKLGELHTGSVTTLRAAKERLKELIGQEIVKCYHGFQCEKVTGDYLYNCQNIIEGYDLKRSEDCAHIATCEGFKNCLDCNFSGTPSEHCYQSLTIEGYGLIGCHTCQQANADLISCDNCYACKDCIGCVGLRKAQYCILNRQYTKEEYDDLRTRIVSKMQEEGAWGRFFPTELSPFGYNETIAQLYFPLTKEEVQARGWKWKEAMQSSEQYLGPESTIPEDIADATDELSKQIFRCEETGKLFKILPQELLFYRRMYLPLPRCCFDARNNARIALRNPRTLFTRPCKNCGKEMQTTYSPDRPETVYCESCYLETVY